MVSDYVECSGCGFTGLVPLGVETCPKCETAGNLGWASTTVREVEGGWLNFSHQIVIPKSATCEHYAVAEYWHENDDCELDDCAVAECLSCNEFVTECEQGSN